MIGNITFLTKQECLEVCSTIYEQKRFWHQRGSDSFYTLGAASYIDATSSDKTNKYYYGKAKLFNPILRECFGWLYERLSDTLAKELGQPTSYCEAFALPGFHIFPVPKNSLSSGGSMHVDLQYHFLNWKSSEEIDFNNPISFTIAITLPEVGGGMNISDLCPKDVIDFTQEYRSQILDNKKRFYPYKLGNITIHNGLFFHGIAPMQNKYISNDRITLQGHGLLCKGIWKLYW